MESRENIKSEAAAFSSFDAWRDFVNKTIGKNYWYIAGGCAAWLHIDNYNNKDNAYLLTVDDLLKPGDIEVVVQYDNPYTDANGKKVPGEMEVCIGGRYILVDVQPKIEIITDLLRCTELNDTLIFSVAGLITSNSRAGNVLKEAKRKLRFAILTLISKNERIDAASVNEKKKGPTLFEQLKLAAEEKKNKTTGSI